MTNNVIPGHQTVADAVCMAGVQGQMTVTTTPAPVRVGTTNANRKMVTISTSGKDDIYWGWNSEVTSSTGTPLDPWSFNTFAVNKDIDIWLVVADGSDTVRITEVI